VLARSRSDVQGSVSAESIAAIKEVEVGESFLVEQVIDDLSLRIFDCCEEAGLTFAISGLQQIIDLLGNLFSIVSFVVNDSLKGI